jgi:hypothetical protein
MVADSPEFLRLSGSFGMLRSLVGHGPEVIDQAPLGLGFVEQ